MEQYSVLMAVHRKEKAEYFRQAIESMMTQTVPPEEFLLVCDGLLTEALDSVIAHYQEENPDCFRVVRLQQNRGLGTALAIGLQACRNELVARMDADDLARPQRMELLLAELARHPDASVIGGQIAEFSQIRENICAYRTVPLDEKAVRRFCKTRNPMNHVTVLLRRSHVLKAGNYPSLPGVGFEDYYLWIKLLSQGRNLRNIPEICCDVRVNEAYYCRRGGWNYFGNALRVQKLLYKTKRISGLRFLLNTVIWFFGSVVLPAEFRKPLFFVFLRKRTSAKWENVCERPIPMGIPAGRQKL